MKPFLGWWHVMVLIVIMFYTVWGSVPTWSVCEPCKIITRCMLPTVPLLCSLLCPQYKSWPLFSHTNRKSSAPLAGNCSWQLAGSSGPLTLSFADKNCPFHSAALGALPHCQKNHAQDPIAPNAKYAVTDAQLGRTIQALSHVAIKHQCLQHFSIDWSCAVHNYVPQAVNPLPGHKQARTGHRRLPGHCSI